MSYKRYMKMFLLTSAHRSKINRDELIRFIELGMTSRDIAKKLGITRHRIYSYIRNNLADLYNSDEIKKLRKEKTREKIKETWADPERREKMSELFKELWTDPEYKKMMTEKLKAVWDDPEYRERASEISKEHWADPEFRAKMEAMRTDPEYRAKMEAIYSDPEYREKMSESLKKRWENEDFWEWLATFPDEKRRQIINAIFSKKKKSTRENFLEC